MITTSTDLKRTVATNIKLARRLAEMSQAQLEARTGIDENEISRYEHGRRHPGHDRLIKIAAALDQTVGWFYDPHDDEVPA